MTFTEQLNALAAFSSTDPDTQGVTRLPFTPQQQDAAQWLKRQMEDAGLTARVDAYGTVAGVLPGKSEETLLIGSHYDSVPNGGRYDGCSGVIAGIRVAQALREEGVVPAYTLMILGLNDEEGVALTEGFLSSRGVCGEIDEAALDRVRHRTTGESLRQLTGPERAEHIALPKACRGYLEFHVEQGPVLDHEGRGLAVVEHIVGICHGFWCIYGEQNHAGTTPMELRKDPMPVFGQIAAALPDLAKRYPKAVATIGNVEVDPNAPNVIPGSVRFSVDLRHTDKAVMAALRRDVEQLIEETAAAAGLKCDHQPSTEADPVTMDPTLCRRLEACLAAEGQPVYRMDSGAGHDAQIFARHVPAVMMFAPSRDGQSHSRREFTEEKYLEQAVRVMTRLVKEKF